MRFKLIGNKLTGTMDKPKSIIKNAIKPPVKKTIYAFTFSKANAGRDILRLYMKCRNSWNIELPCQLFSASAKAKRYVKMSNICIFECFIICTIIRLCKLHSLRFYQLFKKRNGVTRRTYFIFRRITPGQNCHSVSEFPQLVRIAPRCNSGSVIAIIKLINYQNDIHLYPASFILPSLFLFTLFNKLLHFRNCIREMRRFHIRERF